MFSKDSLLAQAKKPAEDALRLHPLYKGKIQITHECIEFRLVKDTVPYDYFVRSGPLSKKIAKGI